MTMAALVCIAKNEDHYIDEWIQYHLKLGFFKIFVYQNDWRYAGDKEKYGDAVVWIEFDGEAMQMKAYNDFIDSHYADYDFAAFFDVDEFLCLKEDKSLDAFLSRYHDVHGIGVNWRVFGDNNLSCIADEDYSLLNRFTKCQNTLDRHIKTILNLRLSKNFFHFVNPHFIDASIKYDLILDVDKKYFIHGPWNYNCTSSIAQLNHYHSKTYSEFIEKMKRGKADTLKSHPQYNYLSSDFNKHNFNDVEDTCARDFMNNDHPLAVVIVGRNRTRMTIKNIESMHKHLKHSNVKYFIGSDRSKTATLTALCNILSLLAASMR